MNELLVKSLIATGELCQEQGYDLDFDHQFIETEKYDAKRTYKKFTGYSPGVAVIGDHIVGIEIGMATRMSGSASSVHWKESSPGWNVTAFI